MSNIRALTPANLPHAIDVANRNAMASITRACLATGLKALPNQQQWPAAEKILDTDKNADLLTKAAIPPTTPAGTQALTQIAYAFVEALIPVSASAALIARSLQLQFDQHSEVRIPALTVPRAFFIGENEAIPVQQGTSSTSAVLDPYKLAVIIELSGEIMRGTNAEAMVRAVLLASVGTALDAAIFSTAAGVPAGMPGARPPGILLGAATQAGATGGGLDAMVQDLQWIADTLKGVAGNGQICLVAAPKQAVALVMLPPSGAPWPVFVSAALTENTVIAVAAQALATIIGIPRIEARNAITIQEQTTPTGDLETGSPVRSTFQTDAVGIRFILPCSWAMRGAGVAYITGTTW